MDIISYIKAKRAAESVTELAGEGRTTETVKQNADDIATVEQDLAQHKADNAAHGATQSNTPFTIPFRNADGIFSVGDATAGTHALNRNTADGRYVRSITDEYDLPLSAGLTNYQTITSSYDCKIYKHGNLVTVVFAFTKNSGTFSENEQVAMIPVGLRPKATTQFAFSLTDAPNPQAASATNVGMGRARIYRGGTFNLIPDGIGNRAMGVVTYPIA